MNGTGGNKLGTKQHNVLCLFLSNVEAEWSLPKCEQGSLETEG